MAKGQEKRNSWKGIAITPPAGGGLNPGVGGRQGDPAPLAGGGGYLNICTASNFDPASAPQKKRDPRLDELRRMGLQRVWMEVAETIGVDAFLAMWRIIDADQTSHSKEGRLEVSLRLYRSYLRFQRNRYIETLASRGFKLREIKKRVADQLCERIGIAHISRIARRG